MNVEQIADRVRKEMWLSELTHEAAVEFLRRCLIKIGERVTPVCSQFQSRDGEWKFFIDANHEHNTRDSLAWPVRELYATPAEAILAAEQKVAEARAEVKSLTQQAISDACQYEEWTRERLELRAKVGELQAWRDAVEDALVIDGIFNKSHSDPRKAVADLLAWESDVATDPAVSTAAIALQYQVAEACAKYVNRFISGDGILNDVWVHEIEEGIRAGKWRDYL